MHGRILYVQGFLYHRGDHFRFGSVFIKKSNQTEFKKKKPKPNRNLVKPTGFGAVQFGFLGQKPIQTGLARFSRFWLGFCSVWLGFFLVFFGFGSVRFGFFGFLLIKPKPNQTGRFFQNFNRFNWFFFGFLGLIGFLVFLLTPTIP